MFSYKKQNKKTDEIFNWGVLVCLNGQEDEKKEIQEKKKEKRRRRRRGKLSRNERNLEYLTCQLRCELQSSAVIPSFLYITVDCSKQRDREREERKRQRQRTGWIDIVKSSRYAHNTSVQICTRKKNNNKNISKIKSEKLHMSLQLQKSARGKKKKQERLNER